jgi:hypothetical protein
MKKIYFSIILMLAAFVSAEAKVIYLGVNLVSPAPNAILTCGVPFMQTIVITNMGPGAIAAGDTVLYADPYIQQGSAYVKVGYTKNVNDTILLTKSVTLTTSNTNGPRSYCVLAAMRNGSTITPDSIYTKCNNITIAGGTSQGIASEQLNEVVKATTLKVYPNPAASVANLDFAAQNNSDVVVRVYDITGREVLSNNFGKAYQGQTGYQINVGSLTKGIYMVEMRQDGVKSVGRFNKD